MDTTIVMSNEMCLLHMNKTITSFSIGILYYIKPLSILYNLAIQFTVYSFQIGMFIYKYYVYLIYIIHSLSN